MDAYSTLLMIAIFYNIGYYHKKYSDHDFVCDDNLVLRTNLLDKLNETLYTENMELRFDNYILVSILDTNLDSVHIGTSIYNYTNDIHDLDYVKYNYYNFLNDFNDVKHKLIKDISSLIDSKRQIYKDLIHCNNQHK